MFAAAVSQPTLAAPPQPTLPLAADTTVETASPAMAKLARTLLKTYSTKDRETRLDNLFRLQSIAGEPVKALATLAELRRLRIQNHSMQARARDLQFVILAKARKMGPLSQQSFAAAFHNVVGRLDDKTADLVVREINVNPAYYPFALRFADALKVAKAKPQLSPADALALVRAYQLYNAYRAFAAYAAPLIAAEDTRHYAIENAQVKTTDGASISVVVVRPRKMHGKLPALLNFTIYADPQSSLNEARRSAANGYIGVEGFTRGKMHSPDKPVAYEDDGKDADAVIEWIARQPWSDGRVGMYGGSYEGFTQWAAAKHLPKALKALMPSVSAAPGIDVPMEGNVFQTFIYYWPFYALSNKTLYDKGMNDRARWRSMEQRWYESGQAYRDLPKIDGAPNPAFERWLDHPSYDAYWQAMIPYREDFAKINIPVLTTTGYYDGGQIGALYYYREYRKYNPQAENYLLIGPYDHVAGQRGTISVLGEPRDTIGGYTIDPVAQIDLGTLRYAWFDYVFKHGRRPAILKNRVNFEVMGANTWRHVPSIAAMSNADKRFYLTPKKQDGRHSLSTSAQNTAVTPLTVNLAERKKEDPFTEYGRIVTHSVDDWDGLTFVSAPFSKKVQFNGLFRGNFDVVANKKDFDFEVDLYELRPDGTYFRLSYYMARASYVEDRTTRHLLTPGAHTHLTFTAGRMTSRELHKGSRLVMVLSVIKNPFAQINYGTGKDVSDETIADAGAPLKLQWYGDSTLTVPLWQ
ncbi:MAG: CocE/NonD family hydrolase [Gammaproteobacteria bacterium]